MKDKILKYLKLKYVPLSLFLGVLAFVAVGLFITLPARGIDNCLKSKGYESGTFEKRAIHAAKIGFFAYDGSAASNAEMVNRVCGESDDLGFGVVTDFQKQLSAPMTSDQTFIPLSNLMLTNETDTTCAAGSSCLDANALGNKVFVTIDPGKDKIEVLLCTQSSTSTNRLTVCTRGLGFMGTSLSAVTANAKTHRQGATIVLSNTHFVYDSFLDLTGKGGTTQTLTGNFSVTGTVIMATSSGGFYLGDDTDSKNKTWFARNGETNYPFLRYNETSGRWSFSDNGVDTISFVTSSAGGLSASSSRAIGITDSKIHVNASSSQSANGGYLNFASSTGYLFWDIAAFLTGAARTFTALIADTFTGTSTANGLQITTAPDTDYDAVNSQHLNYLVSRGYATGTAGITIAAGNALYISTTGTLFLTDPAATSTSQTFVGIAVTGGAAAAEIIFAPPRSILDSLSSLTQGVDYYLSGTAGAITATKPSAPDLPVVIGRSLSASRLQVKDPTINLVYTVDYTDINSDQTVTIGVTPDKVTAYCGNKGTLAAMVGANSRGEWIWDKIAGASSTATIGQDSGGTEGYFTINTGAVCAWEDGANMEFANITPSQTGFIFDVAGSWSGGGAHDAALIVEYRYP